MTIPVLLMLLLGVVEFGRVWNTKQAVTDAAREGARVAVVHNPAMTQDSVRARIATALSRSGIPGVAVTIAFDEQPEASGGNWRKVDAQQNVYVGVQYRFGFFGPLIKAVNGTDQIRISSLVTMRNE